MSVKCDMGCSRVEDHKALQPTRNMKPRSPTADSPTTLTAFEREYHEEDLRASRLPVAWFQVRMDEKCRPRIRSLRNEMLPGDLEIWI